MVKTKIRKTPYYAAVSKGVLDIVKMYDEHIVIRLALLFTNKTLVNTSDALANHLKHNIKKSIHRLDGNLSFILIKCQDINEKEVLVLKVFNKETNKIISKLNQLLLLL